MYITGKKARHFVSEFTANPYRTLSECYKRPSIHKRNTWLFFKDKSLDYFHPGIVTVISYTCQTFTVAWPYIHPDTGVLMLHVETYANSYDMEM